ncbi:enoyl-CoA hydratase-related protein [Pseudarthrobacter sp. fls2-241-R2A-168]|uniref:enoyl-CoA hydratase-related protein n=1 Tax=Pseudarthrobacter sp. fls2-241-R2A-168 TaxID=3040304 RepID=UPI002552BA4A|nr:enoyl-CoA hydratase-related protein [Pseudarthrobacter sp. fls2-241-R2A-168]
MSGKGWNGADSLLVTDRGSVRYIEFNRPEVHNAQNVAMLEALDDVLRVTAQAKDVRAVVLGGVGKSFCSGHDLNQMATNAEYRENFSTVETRSEQEMRLFVGPVERFRNLQIPTICRVQGHCLAAGVMFAGSADFVVAADNASFGSPILRHLAVNDAEVFTFALRLGERRAKQMIWLDDRLDAEDAKQAGVVNWVVPLDQLDAKVAEVADKLAAAPPEALALSKATFRFAADRQGESDINRFHYMAHQLSHATNEAAATLTARVERVQRNESPIPEAQRNN